MYGSIKAFLQNEIQDIKEAGLFKEERIITSPQGAEIILNTGEKVPSPSDKWPLMPSLLFSLSKTIIVLVDHLLTM